jgi:hypothetical protein
LLVIADAINGHPMLVKNILNDKREVVLFMDYKYKNRFVAFSPIANAALLITRHGTIKWASFEEGSLVQLGDEQLKLNSPQWGSRCLGMFPDGMRGIAVDASGRLFFIDFSIERGGVIRG